MNDSDESHPIGPKQPCPSCPSSDAYQLYSDGHGYCFSCGHYQHSDAGPPVNEEAPANPKYRGLLEMGDVKALPSRGISAETCAKFGYTRQRHEGEGCQVAHYRDSSGAIVAQKLRFQDKSFKFLGEPKKALLYGQHLFDAGGATVIITEGEIDCLSVAEVFSASHYAIVSIPHGAQGAAKALRKELEWVSSFDKVVLCLDNDEQGREATEECARLFKPGKAYVAKLTHKDPNEYLQHDQAQDLRKAIWDAEEYRPDGIVSVADILHRITEKPAEGYPWFLPNLNVKTYGRRTGECVALGAGTGVGKTDFIVQQISYDLFELHQKVAVFAFETNPADIVRRVIGKKHGALYHVPGADFGGEALTKEAQQLADNNSLFLYDHFGSAEWPVISERIRYLAHAHEVKFFYIDHLTALAALEDDEKKALERIMAELGALVQELDIWVLFVSHLSTPDGKPHEEGGRVAIRHFKGSRSIGYWSHFMIALERNGQDDDEDERHTSTLRILKDRLTGQGTGETFRIKYDKATGRIAIDTELLNEENDYF